MQQIHSFLEPYRIPLTDNKKADDILILQGKEYIRQHLYEPFNLEQVASYLHISKYHFIRKFKQKVARDGVPSEFKKREAYDKPGVRRRNAKKEGIKNSQKRNRANNRDY